MIIIDKNNKLGIVKAVLLNTLTEYCEDLYNYKIRPDNNLLKKNTMNNNEEQILLILEYEVRTILALKNGKSILAEEQTCFSKSRSTIKQILNCILLTQFY